MINFPHHEFDKIEEISNTINLEKEDLIHKSFIFDPEQLKQLKVKTIENGDLAKCSSFEALVALTWKMRTRALSLHPNQRMKLLFPVDGRSRFDPPIPHGYFGNCVVFISWCKLAFDTTDFGWGVPHVSGLASSAESKEIIMFLAHGSDRKSINVLVGLPASAMKIFEELMTDVELWLP
ncbi:hypothetical protein RJ639_041982 [Escallonia herrerae]|uniref:Uncharacterized protein n=1 Tax=Escallonia herrerae TaxID=1293975 RepID=A0AA88WKB9_9ASTE|nr:hypothetical protein RJ639_041982 [Escallonia herrerae]